MCDPMSAARSVEENPAAAKWAFASAADTSGAGSWFGGAAAVASLRPMYFLDVSDRQEWTGEDHLTVLVVGPPGQLTTACAVDFVRKSSNACCLCEHTPSEHEHVCHSDLIFNSQSLERVHGSSHRSILWAS